MNWYSYPITRPRTDRVEAMRRYLRFIKSKSLGGHRYGKPFENNCDMCAETLGCWQKTVQMPLY